MAARGKVGGAVREALPTVPDRRERDVIYVTGDIHGADSINRLSKGRWPQARGLTRDDFVIILGDFGLVWSNPPSAEDEWWLRWLDRYPAKVLFVDGNHENHDLLDAMPVTEWMGGRVHEVTPNVLHLMRGEVFDLPDGDGTTRVLAFGGARSHDVPWRTEGLDWWPRELPDEGDFRNACESLDAVGWRVDYVLSHDCPSVCKLSVMLPPSLYSLGDYGESARWKDDRLNGYLDEIDARLDYKAWYFGHYHTNAACVDGRHACLYRDIVRLGELPR